jgi:hypothetical protein
MTTTLNIVTSTDNTDWILTFSLVSPADIPLDIFVYLNTGTGLGQYQTICAVSDYLKIQQYTPGVNVPIFGNQFLKHTIGVLTAPLSTNVVSLRSKLVADVTAFKTGWLSISNNVQNVNI